MFTRPFVAASRRIVSSSSLSLVCSPSLHHRAFAVFSITNQCRTTSALTATTNVLMAGTKRTAHSALDEVANDNSGKFVRTDSTHRHHIVKGGTYEPESGRYHLYVSYACPWAHRTLMVRALKGLEDAISVSVVAATWARTRPDDDDDTHTGWVFKQLSDPPMSGPTGHGEFTHEGVIPDPHHNFKTVRDIYDMSHDTGGKYSVPVLWDTKTNTIVNNESSEIIRMFNSEFNDLAKNPSLDLYPAELAKEIDAVNEWVYPTINNGVYKCGFAKKQGAYDDAVVALFEGLDRCEKLLGERRFIAGDTLTEADIRLVVTLFRFDEVYTVYFKCNVRMLHSYHNILNYVREVYQLPGIADTVNMQHIKTHYYTSHPTLNCYAVVPIGYGAIADFEKPHDRATKKF